MSDAAPGSQVAIAGHMLERARWAAHAYRAYSATDVARIVAAVAEAGHANARRYAEWAVRETGFGVVEHKALKNEACSSGLLREYAADDFVTPRVDSRRMIVEVPRPAGVVLALTPSTNPVATVYFKVLLALMTRNVVVVSPHPMARECCADAAALLGQAAVAAGAPDGVVQIVRQPTIPLVEALMADERVSVIVATGGTGVVRSAYSSGNPALGVGPGNVPVLVDATADVPAAARLIVESKAFDNSVLCTNESVLIAESAIAGRLTREMEQAGAAILDRAAARQLSAYMFPSGTLSTAVVGKDASWIAQQAGLRVPAGTRLLVAPFDIAVPEEPLAHEKLSPVLGMITVPSAARGIEAAGAVVRIAGAGHSAAIHSTSPETVLRYAARVPVLRVSANVGNSTGSSGIDTNLATSMTIGTGFVGRSGLGENLQPGHLVDWTRVAYGTSAGRMPDFSRVSPWRDRAGPVPAYPLASNDPRSGTALQPSDALGPGGSPRPARGSRPDAPAVSAGAPQSEPDRFRAEIRQLVLAELSQLLKD